MLLLRLARVQAGCKPVVCENPHLAPKFLHEEESRFCCESPGSACCKSPARRAKPPALLFAIPQPPAAAISLQCKILEQGFSQPVPRHSLSYLVSPALSHSLTWCKRPELPREWLSTVGADTRAANKHPQTCGPHSPEMFLLWDKPGTAQDSHLAVEKSLRGAARTAYSCFGLQEQGRKGCSSWGGDRCHLQQRAGFPVHPPPQKRAELLSRQAALKTSLCPANQLSY